MTSLGVHPKILADQLTLSQSGGTDYAHLITTGTPGFSNPPMALYEACQMSILHDDSIQFNSLEFEDCSDSRVHKVSPICMLVIVYNNFQQPDPSCLAPLKLDTVSRI